MRQWAQTPISVKDSSNMTLQENLVTYAPDGLCFLASCLLFLGYQYFIKWKSRNNPVETVQGISSLARAIWVRRVMEQDRDILTVQTLRNSTMAATFMASTAILLTVGVLTLSGQSDKLKITWHLLDYFGGVHESLMPLKLILILLDLFSAFFLFASSIRLYNDVGYMINARCCIEEKHTASPKVVATPMVSAQLNRAGDHYRMGMRGFYGMLPLVFWIFGPFFLLMATVIVVIILYHLDRTYTVEHNFHQEQMDMYCLFSEDYCVLDENDKE